MPRSLPRPCIVPRCPNLTRSTRCDEHQTDRDRELDQRRPTAHQRGYDERHRGWRAEVLERYPVCRICGDAPSTVADHIVPIRDGGARFDLANGQGTCAPCHNSRKQSEDQRKRAR